MEQEERRLVAVSAGERELSRSEAGVGWGGGDMLAAVSKHAKRCPMMPAPDQKPGALFFKRRLEILQQVIRGPGALRCCLTFCQVKPKPVNLWLIAMRLRRHIFKVS